MCTLNRIKSRLLAIVLFVVAARTLGHGRRMEMYLILAAGLETFILFWFPSTSENAHAISDLFWYGWGPVLYVPFLVVFVVQGYGLAANANAWPLSRCARFAGALCGFWVWMTYAAKLYSLENVATPGFSLAVLAAVYGEIGVMFFSAANVPRPGAPGNTGT